MKKKRPSEGKITNKRARFDYDLSDSLVVGIALNGRETKALRLGHGQLRGAYVTVKGDELFLTNATISSTNNIPLSEDESTQARKLLARRKEIDQLIVAKKQGSAIIPTEILTKGRFIKLRISLGKGKKNYDKRNTMKERDDARNSAREISRKTS